MHGVFSRRDATADARRPNLEKARPVQTSSGHSAFRPMDMVHRGKPAECRPTTVSRPQRRCDFRKIRWVTHAEGLPCSPGSARKRSPSRFAPSRPPAPATSHHTDRQRHEDACQYTHLSRCAHPPSPRRHRAPLLPCPPLPTSRRTLLPRARCRLTTRMTRSARLMVRHALRSSASNPASSVKVSRLGLLMRHALGLRAG